ncbi:hypothetical protein [Azospirillum sp.]|uniref:hypothetical protein n=1 Tax=Azospirillum sp. TaxID=34012 RepID=UPI003D718D3E
MPTSVPSSRPLTYDDVVATVGRIDAASVAAILDTGASPEDLAEAFAWYSLSDDAVAEARHTLSGRAERVYRILIGDDEFPAER